MITTAKKFAAFLAASASCGLVAILLTGEAQGSRSPEPAALSNLAIERIDAAFATVAETPAAFAAKRQALRKGDRAPMPCAGAAWPAVRAECLVGADGGAPKPAARTVTVEYRTGHATSTLVRMPIDLVASR